MLHAICGPMLFVAKKWMTSTHIGMAQNMQQPRPLKNWEWPGNEAIILHMKHSSTYTVYVHVLETCLFQMHYFEYTMYSKLCY